MGKFEMKTNRETKPVSQQQRFVATRFRQFAPTFRPMIQWIGQLQKCPGACL
jgi:hypothetical protein